MQATVEPASWEIVRCGSVPFVSQLETHASIRPYFLLGTLSPLHASGTGKELLAKMPSGRVARIGGEWLTENTLAKAEDLIVDFATTRARAHAIEDE